MRNYLITDTKTTIYRLCLACHNSFKVKRNTFGKYCSRLCYFKTDKNPEMGRKISATHLANGFTKGENNYMFGKTHSPKARLKISMTHKGEIRSEEWKTNQSQIMKKLWKQGKMKGHKMSNETKEKLRKIFSTEEHIKKIFASLKIRPTSLEKQMIKIIEKYSLPYKYTGDGSFLIGYKNPDFVNINGEKKLIEVGNTFHHKPSYIKERSAHFEKYGWKSVIFLANKLNEEEVINKLKKDF